MMIVVKETRWYEVEVSEEELLAAMPEETSSCTECRHTADKVRHWSRDNSAVAVIEGREKLNVEPIESEVVGVDEWIW
jgi:hypothetical protein